MSKISIDMSGINDLIDKIGNSPSELLKQIKISAQKDAELLALKARENAPVDIGTLRESIVSYCKDNEDKIEAGATTNLSYAAFVEFGTGQTGTENGHPLDSELGISRKMTPWLVNIPGVGPRYINGQKAQPFMYPAMKEMQEIIKQDFGSCIKEALK